MHYACRDILLKPMTFAGPNNYLQVPGFFRKPRMFVKFKFRSWDYTGLLMFTRFADDLGALELGLSEGQINVTIFQPGKKKLQFAAGRSDAFLLALSCMTEKTFVHGTPMKMQLHDFSVTTSKRTPCSMFTGASPCIEIQSCVISALNLIVITSHDRHLSNL